MATKKTKTKAKQHTEAELLLFKNYSLSSSTLSSKVNKYSKKCTKQVSLFKRGFIININENEDQYEKQISNKITLVMKGMYWYSFVTNYWGKGSNKLHQGENYQDLLKWVGGSFGHSLIIKRIWGFFPKICNWTPSPIFWYKKETCMNLQGIWTVSDTLMAEKKPRNEVSFGILLFWVTQYVLFLL